jgi:two-component system, response regulator RegA
MTDTTLAPIGLGRSILLVDDDEAFRERLGQALRLRGFVVVTAGDLPTAVASAKRDPPDFAVVDMRMPDASGLDVVDAIVPLGPDTKIVILTGYGSIASAVEALHRGAHHYLSKPIDADELTATLLRLESDGEGEIPPAVTADGSTPTLARAEWEHIQRVLADVGGNVSEAARRLRIARRTLQLKLKKYPPRH